jgi:hypothetical protein
MAAIFAFHGIPNQEKNQPLDGVIGVPACATSRCVSKASLEVLYNAPVARTTLPEGNERRDWRMSGVLGDPAETQRSLNRREEFRYLSEKTGGRSADLRALGAPLKSQPGPGSFTFATAMMPMVAQAITTSLQTSDSLVSSPEKRAR